MNWLDLSLIIILIVSLIQGMRLGMFGALINASSLFVGWLLAGTLSQILGDALSDSIASDTIVTIIAYVSVIVAAWIVGRSLWKLLRPILGVATLGLMNALDRLGGVALGLLMGLIICSACITGLSRLAYNLVLPDTIVTDLVIEDGALIHETKQVIEDSLTESTLVPVFLNAIAIAPDNLLGFVPSDFKVSLGILENKISR